MPPLALRMRMRVARDRAEIPLRLLPANPLQKWRKLRRFPQRLERHVRLGQVGIPKRGVDLLMTWLAQRRAMLRLAPFFLWLEMMLRDEMPRHMPLAQLALRIIRRARARVIHRGDVM